MNDIITIIGDVHGKFDPYKNIISNLKNPSIQVGDMGIGFGLDSKLPSDLMLQNQHRFLRGNHDDPAKCLLHPCFIKDGTIETLNNGMKIMYVGGALSIDRDLRTEGVDWWKDEELSYVELDKIMDDYIKCKPDIMITHDAPESVINEIYCNAYNRPLIRTRTGQALDMMFSYHVPRHWIFGHYHLPLFGQVNKCYFRCLPELHTIDIQL